MKMKKDKSWGARWGEIIANRGCHPVPNEFLNHYREIGISSGEALFIIHLTQYKQTSDNPYPSFYTIAKKMGKSRSVIQGYARSLENKGFIKRIPQKGWTNQVDISLLIKRVETLCGNLNKVIVEKPTTHYAEFITKKEMIKKENISIRFQRNFESSEDILKRKFGN